MSSFVLPDVEYQKDWLIKLGTDLTKLESIKNEAMLDQCQILYNVQKLWDEIDIEATLFPQRALEEKVAAALPAGEACDVLDLGTMSTYPYYVAGLFEMEPNLTTGNAITGSIYGFDFLYNDLSHYGTAPIVASLSFRETGLRHATAVLTELRYIDIAKTAYGTTHAGTITNVVGLDIGDIDKGATLNYAIRTQAGDIMLNEGNGQCDLILKGANYNLIETDSSDDELYLCKNTASKLSIFNVTPIAQAAHITDADGTLASVTAQFNALLANVIEPFGFTATS